MESGGYPEYDNGIEHRTTIVMLVDGGHYQGTYTKIFLQFPEKFWFDTQVDITQCPGSD